jgi:hypothetical protein
MKRTCSCGARLVERDGWGGPIVAAHCATCHLTVKAGDPCACMEPAALT